MIETRARVHVSMWMSMCRHTVFKFICNPNPTIRRIDHGPCVRTLLYTLYIIKRTARM